MQRLLRTARAGCALGPIRAAWKGRALDKTALEGILQEIADGKVSPTEAAARLAHFPFEELEFAKVDHQRSLRCGFPEVIFCAGKTPEQVVEIAQSLRSRGETVLATRAEPATAAALDKAFTNARHNETARTVIVPGEQASPRLPGLVLIVSAGTSDQPVAEEARETAEVLGCSTRAVYDAGVAGIHRLLAHSAELGEATVVVAVAGMEGALPSVVGGLVDAPVIAVPTSVGYGANLGGFAPLLTMLNSCASGVMVVNIDNGFGAAYSAALVCRAAMKSAGKS